MPKTANRAQSVNESGRLIGEDHPRAVLSDHDVDLVLELRAEGKSYAWLALKMEISKSQVARICRGEQRAQLAVAWRPRRAFGKAGGG